MAKPHSFIDIGKPCLSREFFTTLIIRENKILAKISESTVFVSQEPFSLFSLFHHTCSMLNHLSRMEFPNIINWTSPFPFPPFLFNFQKKLL